METLILVDFDNLLGFWQAHDPKTLPLMGAAGSADWWQPDRPETTAVLVGPGELPDLVVAVALNTTSALPSASGRPAPTMSYIRRLAASFGPRLYPNAKVGVEVGLVLRYPDAVDDLLVALVHQAALPEDVGVLKEVLLVSRDGGLVGRLGGRLREHSHRRNGIVHTWRPLHSTKRILRLYQTPDPPGAGTATEPALFRSTRVQSAAQARAVSTWPLDITANADLADMARLVEAHPSILTQIGATTPSLRGLARLVRSDAPAPSIPTGACAATDGLEFHRPQDPSPGQVTVSATETSPLGPGAVYLPDQAATVRCAAPYRVLVEAAQQNTRRRNAGSRQRLPTATLTADVSEMDLESLLMALSRGRQFGELDPTNVLHMVTIRARDRNLEGAFDPAGAVGQKAWWVLMDRNRGYQDSSRVSVRGAADLVDGQAPLRVHANLMRRDTRAEPTHPHNWPEIVAVCAAWTHGQPDIRATATRSIGAGTIGPARVGPYNAAILAPNAPIGPGVVVCQPIHKVDSKIWFPSGQEVLSRMWFHLQRLPLLVPEVGATCPPQPAPSVSAGGHTPEP